MTSTYYGSRLSKIALGAALAIVMLSPRIALADTISSVSTTPDLFNAMEAAKSGFLSGYKIKKGPFKTATNTFKVPSVSCDPGLTQGIAVGIGNETAKGRPTLLGIVFVACQNGSPLFELEARVSGDVQQSPSVSAGDTIKVALKQTGSAAVATVTDTTSNVTVMASDAPRPDDTVTYGSFPLFLINPKGKAKLLRVPNFGSISMKNNTFNGKVLKRKQVTPISRKQGTTI